MVGGLVAANLSAREFEVLAAMADGLTNDGIASHLSLGRKTVEAAVGSVFVKLGLRETTFENRRVMAVKIFLAESSPSSGMLPSPPSAFVGRTEELAQLEDVVRKHRVVTVAGPGGMGKTRLAIELGRCRVERGLPVRFVDLAAAGDTAVLEAIFDAFGLLMLRSGGGLRPLERALRAKPSLVIIDNAEHVLDRVAAIVSTLSTIPKIELLVTSREPLNSENEFVWRIPSMNRSDSRRLLIDRTTTGGAPSASLDDSDVIDLWTDWLDGMPLAIELIARRLASLPIQHVTAGRHELPNLLQRPGPGRHANLRSVFNASVESLDDEARTLFARLSVFVGGFTLDAAHECFGDNLTDGIDLVLERLVSASLVSFGLARYRMLEPIRQYANELLVRSDQQGAAEDRLVKWCVRFAQHSYRGFALDPVRWRPMLTAESGNIDAALASALAVGNVGDALRIVGRLWNFWTTEHAAKGWDRVNQVLESLDGTEDVPDRALALLGAGWLAHHMRNAEAARTLLGQSADLFEGLDDDESLTIALHLLAQEHDEPERFDRPIELAHMTSNAFIESWACAMKGEWSMRHRRGWQVALACLDRAKQTSRRARLDAPLAGTLRAKAHSMLTANWLGETSHAWQEIDNVAAECEKIVRRAPGAWQLADILSVRCRNDLADGRLESARARTVLLLEHTQLTDDPSVLSEAVLIAATALAAMNDTEVARKLVANAGPVFYDLAGPFSIALTLDPRNELYADVSRHLAEPRADVTDLLDLADQAAAHLHTRTCE